MMLILSCTADAGTADQVVPRMMAFWQFFYATSAAVRSVLSIRDLLAWARFVNLATKSMGALPAYAHGAYLVLLDGIGLGLGMQMEVYCLSYRLEDKAQLRPPQHSKRTHREFRFCFFLD